MASLRGAEVLWGASDVGVAVLTTEHSALSNIGDGPNVAVYIDNEGAVDATFDVEVSASDAPEPGRNAIDDSDSNGGLTWYPYSGATGIIVQAGKKLCFDLSPFAPPFLRLRRTDGGGSTTIFALVSSTGPN